MSHKQLITRWFEEVWNKKRESAVDEMLAPKVLIYGIPGDVIKTPAEFKISQIIARCVSGLARGSRRND